MTVPTSARTAGTGPDALDATAVTSMLHVGGRFHARRRVQAVWPARTVDDLGFDFCKIHPVNRQRPITCAGILNNLTRLRPKGVFAMSGKGVVVKRCGCIDPTTGRRRGTSCPRLVESNHGSWYFHCSTVDIFGRAQRVRRGGHPSKTAAAQAMEEFLAQGVADRTAAGWTVARWLRFWLSTRTAIRPTTRLSHTGYIEQFLIPHLGHMGVRADRAGHQPLRPATHPVHPRAHPYHAARRAGSCVCSARPICHQSGCTTCVTVPRAWPTPPART